MDKVKVSIIIPVYNSEEYLDACVAGILKQDMTSYEVILVDDGSTDSSPLICDRLSSTDSRFRTIHKSNGGVSSARNAGIALAQGEYVTFIDSDDILAPGALKALVEATAGSPDLVVGGFDIYQDEILYGIMRSSTASCAAPRPQPPPPRFPNHHFPLSHPPPPLRPLKDTPKFAKIDALPPPIPLQGRGD